MEIEKSSEKVEAGNHHVEGEKGGLRTMPFIIANETFEKVASVGLHANMILYLKNLYHMGSAKGASVLFVWSAMSNVLPIFGAFLSDSYYGRFRVIAIGTALSLLGMTMLWLTALFPQARPGKCDSSAQSCAQANSAQLMLLFSSFALMSIGAGGIRPCSLAFGADQLNNPNHQKNERTLQSFFNWYYALVGISVTIAVIVIVYIQNTAGWVVGFGIPVGLMLISVIMFLLGSSLYVKVKAEKSLFTGFAQVMVAAWKNRQLHLSPQNSDSWFYHNDSKLAAPTDKLRACIIRNKEKDLTSDGLAKDPWRLCTVKQVEQLKALIEVLPIWSTGILFATTINQHSISTLQANSMNRHVTSHFEFPAASFSVFTVMTLTIWVAIYDRAIAPLLSMFTKQPRGLSFRQRMGLGLAVSCLASVVSAEVERKRRKMAIHEGLSDTPNAIVSMSAMWLVPQHCLIGLAEALNAIGQIEFYYAQFPKSMSSIGMAFLALGTAAGNLVGGLIINVVNEVTKKRGKEIWISDNLNKGHYDYYYWILTSLGVVNLFYYVLCSWFYGSCKEERKLDEDEDMKESSLSFHH